MDSKFKIGSRVSLLDEKEFGVIQEMLNSNQVLVLRDDGFEEIYLINKLLLVNDKTFSEEAFKYIPKSNKDFNNERSIKSKKHKKNSNLIWEVDLHIEHLIDNHVKMSNFEIVQIQLKHCKEAVERAIKNNIPRLVIIHGRGEGVLKKEVLILLKRYPAQAKDADYREYGYGATEVIFF